MDCEYILLHYHYVFISNAVIAMASSINNAALGGMM